MRAFRTADGREWKLKVTLPILRTMKDEGIADLLEPKNVYESMPLFLELPLEKQVDALDVAIRPNRDSFDPIDFAESLDEESITDGILAFCEALADFYPRQRETLLKILHRATAKTKEAHALALKGLEPQIDRIIDSSMKAAGNSSTNSPDSLESTQAQ